MLPPHRNPIGGGFIREAHSEFVRLYNEYGCQIRDIWHKLDKNERARLFLDHLRSRPLYLSGGNDTQEQRLAMFPEMNPNDVSTSAEYLLNHFEHRATTSLFEQYWAGLDGALGDGPFIT